MPPAAGVADAWPSLLRLQRSIGNAPMRRLLSRGNTSLYTTFEHFLSPCTPRADTQASVLIGWHLGTHAHYHVDTRPALGAAAWPLDLCAQWVTVIVVRESGVVYGVPVQSMQECVPPFTHGVFHWAVRLMMPTMMRDPHVVTLTPPSEAACRLSWGWRSSLLLTGM